MRISTIISVLTALYAGLAQANEVYEWVDAKGVTNYTQQRPSGVDYKRFRTDSSGAPRAVETKAEVEPEETSLTADQQAMFDELKQKETDRQAEIARINAENCEKSHALLERLTGSRRIRVRDDNGEQTMMGEDERQERINEAQRNIATSCAPQTVSR